MQRGQISSLTTEANCIGWIGLSLDCEYTCVPKDPIRGYRRLKRAHEPCSRKSLERTLGVQLLYKNKGCEIHPRTPPTLRRTQSRATQVLLGPHSVPTVVGAYHHKATVMSPSQLFPFVGSCYPPPHYQQQIGAAEVNPKAGATTGYL